MTITITVASRLASIEATEKVVAGNTYPVAVVLDGEWTGTLYMRVRFGALYYDIPFQSTASTVSVQMPVGYPEVGIGIFSEALEICTNEARIRLLRSILEEGVEVVEFDNDLYNQWAEEVTELLCDDQFDATSNRPVQNRIITAWKETVALDADVVHKAGAETVGGVKTFTSTPVVSGSQATVDMTSTTPATTTGWKAQFRYRDQDSLVASTIVMTGEASNQIETRVYKPDRSGYYWMRHTAYSDHEALSVQPYYPVDGSGNPQALTANALMASGNIAVDPRIVHTTGAESIAGVKEFVTGVNGAPTDWHRCWASSASVGQICLFAEVTRMDNGRFHYLEFIQSSNTLPAWGRLAFKAALAGPAPVWSFRTRNAGNTPLRADSVVLVSDGTKLYIGARKSTQYGGIECREAMDVLNGATVSRSSSTVTFYAQADIVVLTDTTGYTVYEAVDNVMDLSSAQEVAGQKMFTSPLLTKNTQNNNQINVFSRGVYNSIRSRNYTADDAGYDDTFQLGTTYATSALNSFFVRAFAPRRVKGDASEGQTSIALYLMPNNDGTGAVNLSYRKATGSAVDLAVGSFDGSSFSLLAPTYTEDNNADTRIVNRSMLASTPTVVHTTGAETIAGTKTFNGPIEANSAFRRIRFSKTETAGKWYCLYAMSRSGGGNTALVRLCEMNALPNNHVELAVRIGYGPGYHVTGAMTGVARDMSVTIVRRISDGYLEIWASNTGNGQFIADVLGWRISAPTVQTAESDTKPAVGDVYDEAVDVEVIA